MDPSPIDDLEAARASQQDDTRPEAVAAVHRAGRLTARERMAALLDPDTEVPYGTIAALTPDGAWVAETGGVDAVGSIDGLTVIGSSTDFTDKGGGYGAGRLERLFALAHQHRWPVVIFVDGGGSRARHPRSGKGHLELNGPFGRFMLFDGIAELSGWVPTVAIVSGPSFAGHASLAGFSDFVIATTGSSIGMGGPPMVEAALGLSLSANELAGVEMHERTGGIDLLVQTEPEAIEAARRYLAFTTIRSSGPASATADTIDTLVPTEGAYDMVAVIEALVDEGGLFQLRPNFARSVITGFARMNGRTVGVVANQPTIDDGAIDEQAATKVGRLIELCDVYEYPILSLIDTPGCTVGGMVGDATDDNGGNRAAPGLNRWHTRPVMAHHHRTVPLFAVQIGRGGGLGPAIMGGLASGRNVPALWLAWPSTDIRSTDGFAAVRNQHAFDDVVAPSLTRQMITRLLRHLDDDALSSSRRMAKKHPVDTW
ncbi:MAG: carboxyl transferase domain-containing protein [Acidimicrobiales bacterium]